VARRWYVLALLGTTFFMTIMDGTSLLAALPSIERDLHLDGPAVQWAVTAYALAFNGPLLLCGRAADLLGRRLLRPSSSTTAIGQAYRAVRPGRAARPAAK
jgi:MFS family permease